MKTTKLCKYMIIIIRKHSHKLSIIKFANRVIGRKDGISCPKKGGFWFIHHRYKTNQEKSKRIEIFNKTHNLIDSQLRYSIKPTTLEIPSC